MLIDKGGKRILTSTFTDTLGAFHLSYNGNQTIEPPMELLLMHISYELAWLTPLTKAT